jgi:hypothetical protein
MRLTAGSGPKADSQRRIPALASEQAFCVYLACLARRYSSRSVINPTHQKLIKKDRGFFAGKLEPVHAKHTTLIQHIFLACEDENGENFQADMGTERFADAMDR